MPRVLAILLFPAMVFAQTASSVALTASPNPSALGQPVILTATPTAGATGTALFLANGLPVGTVPILNSQANLTTPLLPAGLLYLQAVYSGDASHASAVRPKSPKRSTPRRPTLSHPGPLMPPGLVRSRWQWEI